MISYNKVAGERLSLILSEYLYEMQIHCFIMNFLIIFLPSITIQENPIHYLRNHVNLYLLPSLFPRKIKDWANYLIFFPLGEIFFYHCFLMSPGRRTILEPCVKKTLMNFFLSQLVIGKSIWGHNSRLRKKK